MNEEMIDFSVFERAGGTTQTYRGGDIVFSQGTLGDTMYLVRFGSVDLITNDQVVETVEAGGLFGEMSLIDGSPRSTTAKVRKACELAPIDKSTFLHMVGATPDFALQVMRRLAQRLRTMNERLPTG